MNILDPYISLIRLISTFAISKKRLQLSGDNGQASGRRSPSPVVQHAPLTPLSRLSLALFQRERATPILAVWRLVAAFGACGVLVAVGS